MMGRIVVSGLFAFAGRRVSSREPMMEDVGEVVVGPPPTRGGAGRKV